MKTVTAFCLLFLPFALQAADYIGSSECIACHEVEGRSWRGSHHDLAMQEATEETVLGDFNDTRFSLHGQTTRFFRRDGKFLVNTDGPDGKQHDYEISYTFGVQPLQQYLIRFPGGRLQALDIAWDSRPKEEGGQRWFHLHPGERITHGDVLHWTGPNLNWNYMCADCHSTNLKKNHDAASGTYDTRWSELDVSCEACHGPGSGHLEWARIRAAGKESTIADKGFTVLLDERKGVQWLVNEATGKPHRSKENSRRTEIEVCARCHARRSQLREDFVPGQPFVDAYRPALLTGELYHPDGQVRDEVYVWGSFQQSRMFQAGVTCSDCHDPHSTDLRAPGEQVCYRCHAADRYARKEHRHHVPGSAGASCVECHMPATTFMGVDRRHDHGFRVPRPDISLATGSPNACNGCHTGKDAKWSAEHIQAWYGRQATGYQDFALALDAARNRRSDAAALLMKLALNQAQPAIARATALGHFAGVTDQRVLMLVQQNLQADDPLLRMGALEALEGTPVRMRVLALPLVWDDLKAIRIQAARLLAAYPAEQLKAGQREVLEEALREYVAVQEFNGERPESQLNLGLLLEEQGDFIGAEAAYRKALRLQPKFVPAWVNLAQLLSSRGRETEAANLLRAGIRQVPDSADLHHALGLSLVRAKKMDEAIRYLGKAAELDRDNSRYGYVHAVALQSAGKVQQALEVLEASHERAPHDLDILYALVTFNRDAGNRETALAHARKIQALLPENSQTRELVESLQEGKSSSVQEGRQQGSPAN